GSDIAKAGQSLAGTFIVNIEPNRKPKNNILELELVDSNNRECIKKTSKVA
ncbi:12816_t:CDS:1, partial [Racocetra fulgida]